jgi:hypothetical protein
MGGVKFHKFEIVGPANAATLIFTLDFAELGLGSNQGSSKKVDFVRVHRIDWDYGGYEDAPQATSTASTDAEWGFTHTLQKAS